MISQFSKFLVSVFFRMIYSCWQFYIFYMWKTCMILNFLSPFYFYSFHKKGRLESYCIRKKSYFSWKYDFSYTFLVSFLCKKSNFYLYILIFSFRVLSIGLILCSLSTSSTIVSYLLNVAALSILHLCAS